MSNRAEAIDILTQMSTNHFYGHREQEALKLAVQALSTQSWIPCSERLPEEEKKSYLVCTDAGYLHQCRWTNINPFWPNLTTTWHWNIFDIPQYSEVIAWMSLPEPYKKGEE